MELLAEIIGSSILVVGGSRSAVSAAAFPEVGSGLQGVSLAFGRTVQGNAPIAGIVAAWLSADASKLDSQERTATAPSVLPDEL